MHHIAYICINIEKSIASFEKLGYKLYKEKCFDKIQNNWVCFLSNDESYLIELIQPANEKSTIKNFNSGIHHLCYDVSNFNGNFKEYFKKLKIGKIFTNEIIAPAIDMRSVVFSQLYDGSYIEFILN